MEEPLFSKLSEMLVPTILALYFLISAHKYYCEGKNRSNHFHVLPHDSDENIII